MGKDNQTGGKQPGEHFLPLGKLQQLLGYIDIIGLDAKEIALHAGLDLTKLGARTEHQNVPAIYYSRLYLELVKAMEARHPAIPWAAGMGTATFRMLLYCIIHCKTLGEALARAEQFQDAVYRLTGHQVRLSRVGEQAKFEYRFATGMAAPSCAPPQWERVAHYDSIAQSSGLRTWSSMIGWLIGRTLLVDAAEVAAPFVSAQYQSMLDAHFGRPVRFAAETTAVFFSADQLENRVVQTPHSLEHFLGHAVYQYWMEDPPSLNTAMAIKSLISGSLEYELPRFEEIADRLHMSASTLRRRLLQENTSYQQLKDECREAAAIEHLHRSDLNIQEIGEWLGFSETSSFVRSFRKWTGMTPKAYRDASQELASD